MPMLCAEVQALLCRHGDDRCICALSLLLDTSRAQLTACNRVIKQKYSATRGAYQLLNGLEDAIENLRESKSPHDRRRDVVNGIQVHARAYLFGDILDSYQQCRLCTKRFCAGLFLVCPVCCNFN